MKRLATLLAAISFFLVFVNSAQAGIEERTFSNPEHEALYDKLIYELRCVVCQNENIAASNADIAKDLRDLVYNMITEKNMNEEQIKDFVVERYGNFVLYRPPVEKSTWLLWGGPFIMLFIGLVALFMVVRNNRRKHEQATMNDKEREKIRDLLK
jgi:cytochrome c-type biogenesis protein CcmH